MIETLQELVNQLKHVKSEHSAKAFEKELIGQNAKGIPIVRKVTKCKHCRDINIAIQKLIDSVKQD